MLYYIDESVAMSAKNNDLQVIDVLKDFEYAWRKGQCLLGASRRTFSMLKEIKSLEEYSLIESYAQGIASLYASLDFFVVLASGNGNVTVMQQFVNKYVVMDIASFSDPKQICLNYLVCENVRDCDFYIYGTKYLLANLLGRSYHLNISEGNGGGGTIIEVLKKYAEYSCLAICDSDKKYPLCKKGKTLTSVLEYFERGHAPRMWMQALDAHEVENLIPLKVLESVRKNKTHKYRMKPLILVDSSNFGDLFLKHFDFKKGFREQLFVEINEQDPSFKDICKGVLELLGKSPREINKILLYGKESSKDLISGFGEDIFNETLNYLQNNVINPSFLKLSDYQQKDWNSISKKVWSLGCAMVPRRL